MITISDGETASLLSTLIFNESGATPESASDAVIVATLIILSFGGQITHEPGMPPNTGAVASILNESVLIASIWPNLSIDRYCNVCSPSPVTAKGLP